MYCRHGLPATGGLPSPLLPCGKRKSPDCSGLLYPRRGLLVLLNSGACLQHALLFKRSVLTAFLEVLLLRESAHMIAPALAFRIPHAGFSIPG